MNRLGLIGKHIGYSFSPSYFSEKWFREGIEHWEYDLFDLPSFPEDLLAWWMKQENLVGVNVTIPYKQDAYRAVEAQNLSSEATEIGAVNTLVFDPNTLALRADNTDWKGFLGALDQEQVLSTGKPALILGNGGAASAIRFALKYIGVDFAIASRQEGGETIGYDQLNNHLQDFGLIVNTTPLGGPQSMAEYAPIPYEEIDADHYFFDLNYQPKMTAAMRMCSLRGAYVQNGEEMLIRQAELAWEFWGNWYQ